MAMSSVASVYVEEGKLVACLTILSSENWLFIWKEVLIYLNVITVSNLKSFPGLVFQYHSIISYICCLTNYHTEE